MESQQPSDAAPRLLTTRQAAERLAVSLRTLERLAAAGDLPAVRFGRSVRIDPADLAAFVERHKQTAATRPADPASEPAAEPLGKPARAKGRGRRKG